MWLLPPVTIKCVDIKSFMINGTIAICSREFSGPFFAGHGLDDGVIEHINNES